MTADGATDDAIFRGQHECQRASVPAEQSMSADRRSCPWCGHPFLPHTSGGRRQRFCSPQCRRQFEINLRQWGQEQFDLGHVTVSALKQRARCSRAQQAPASYPSTSIKETPLSGHLAKDYRLPAAIDRIADLKTTIEAVAIELTDIAARLAVSDATPY